MILWQRKNRIIDALVDRIDELETQLHNRTVERDIAIKDRVPSYEPGVSEVSVTDDGLLRVDLRLLP